MVRKEKLILFLSICGIFLLLAGGSYAIFSATVDDTSKQVVKVGKFEVELVEPATGLSLGEIEPMSDEEGLEQETYYEFSVSNVGDGDAKYKVFLLDDADQIAAYEGSLLDDDYIMVGLEQDSIELGPVNLKEANRLIVEDTLEPTKTHNFKLRLWLNLDSLTDEEVSAMDGYSKFLKLKLTAEQSLEKSSIANLSNSWKDETENEGSYLALYTLGKEKLPSTYTYNNKRYKLETTIDVSEQTNGKVLLGEYKNGDEIIAVITQRGGVVAPVNSSNLFSGMGQLIVLDVGNLDTSNVTNMSHMFSGGFYGSMALTEIIGLNSEKFNTSNVTDMGAMFLTCESLKILDLSSFDTSSVTNMSHMFYKCNKLTSLDVSSFDTSSVKSMGYMFNLCCSLTSIDVSNFDTSNVTNMSHMFSGTFGSMSLTQIIGLNSENFDTSNVTDMSWMFAGCTSLKILDLSNFDTSSVSDMSHMFYNCNKLTSLDVSSFNTSEVTNMQFMFGSSSALTSLDLSTFDTSKVTDMSNMFGGCRNLASIIVGCNWIEDSVTNKDNMISGCGTSSVTKVCNE